MFLFVSSPDLYRIFQMWSYKVFVEMHDIFDTLFLVASSYYSEDAVCLICDFSYMSIPVKVFLN